MSTTPMIDVPVRHDKYRSLRVTQDLLEAVASCSPTPSMRYRSLRVTQDLLEELNCSPSDVNEVDFQRAREIVTLFGGNGLSTSQQVELVAAKLAEHRKDPLGLTASLDFSSKIDGRGRPA